MTTAQLENPVPALHADQHLIAGRYRLHTRIGRGRLGDIFAATDEDYDNLGVEQYVAIQVIPENLVRNNRLFNQLNLGFTTLRSAAHPNIVNHLQFGRDGKFGFLAMELLDGAPMRQLLNDVETLPLEEVKPVVRGIGEALQLLHAKGMVHGNLTSRNVFITEALDVRLLDVVPLDASEMAVRRAVLNKPFSRCSDEDDVTDLACLAYEMLAGKHPFNHIPRAEARLAGLEAVRIPSLADREWNALRLALAVDDKLKTPSIAEFMHEFGVSGTERLWASTDQPTRQERVVNPVVEKTSPIARSAEVPVHSATTAAPVVAVEPIVASTVRPTYARPIRRKANPLRAVFLGALLAGLGTWSYYGDPQAQVGKLIDHIDGRLKLGLPQTGDAIVETPAPSPGQSIPTVRNAPVDRPATAAPLAGIEAPPADSELGRPEPRLEATVGAMDAVSEQATGQPSAAAPTTEQDTANTSGETARRTVDETASAANTESVQTESDSVFPGSVISVSEHDGAVRITRPAIGYSETPLIWWTSEHTAYADRDFISVTHQALPEVANDDSNTLHIPLVNDDLPELAESFFVNFGFRSRQHGQIERIATVRVDIVDDDSV